MTDSENYKIVRESKLGGGPHKLTVIRPNGQRATATCTEDEYNDMSFAVVMRIIQDKGWPPPASVDS